MRKLKLDELDRLSVEEFKASSKTPIIVVLDNIRSAHNVGAFFRTCDALAVRQLVLTGITAKPPHKEIHKSAIGATESVDWIYEKEISTYLETLKTSGIKIIGIEQTDSSISLLDFKLETKDPIAIVFGNEVEGICNSVLTLLDQCIEIPQFGTKHSFNVSVCGGIVLWEAFKQLR